ncbi:MAG: exodeoxyribonuclease III, partial [Salinisphaeraceae bacterium]|nr:exodeoxyribonuclease III [Salinisphaeraceae bacterium]
VRIICCYVPNGQALDSPKYQYKLSWLDALHAYVKDELSRHEKLVVLGDFNIVPHPQDSYNPNKWEGDIFCSPPERQRFEALLDLGLTDTWTLFGEREDKARFTWWDYRGGSFHKNHGLRIDHVLTTEPLTRNCKDCNGDVKARYGKQRSDHIPVTAVFEGS